MINMHIANPDHLVLLVGWLECLELADRYTTSIFRKHQSKKKKNNHKINRSILSQASLRNMTSIYRGSKPSQCLKSMDPQTDSEQREGEKAQLQDAMELGRPKLNYWFVRECDPIYPLPSC